MRNQSLFVKKMIALATALLLLIASNASRVEAATPDLTPQQIEAVIEDAFAGLVTFDVPRVINHFAADAVVEDPVGTPPMQGTSHRRLFGNVSQFVQSNETLLPRHQAGRSGSRRQVEAAFYN